MKRNIFNLIVATILWCVLLAELIYMWVTNYPVDFSYVLTTLCFALDTALEHVYIKAVIDSRGK